MLNILFRSALAILIVVGVFYVRSVMVEKPAVGQVFPTPTVEPDSRILFSAPLPPTGLVIAAFLVIVLLGALAGKRKRSYR